jgi:hypothetical protein
MTVLGSANKLTEQCHLGCEALLVVAHVEVLRRLFCLP